MRIANKLLLFISEFYRFCFHIYENKNLLHILAIRDFKEQYLGSYLGIIWALLKPSLFVFVIWFIFTNGFKGNITSSGIPFILYLLSGYVPWVLFSESLSGSMNSVVGNTFLVKKVSFRVSILPLVKILSSLQLHFIFLLILVIVLAAHGFYPTWQWLQLPYYLFCTVVLILGLGWLTSSLRVFVKDVAQVISVFLQLGFWITPIFWSISIVPHEYLFILQINPLVYIIEGYRNTFLYETWFWEQNTYALSYFLITIMFLLLGANVFKRLRPHFGDVL